VLFFSLIFPSSSHPENSKFFFFFFLFFILFPNSSSIFLRSFYYAPSKSNPLSFNFCNLASSFFFSLSIFYLSFSANFASLCSSFCFAFNFSSSFSCSAIIYASYYLIDSVFLGSSNQLNVKGRLIEA
jgi:hypothetical protein